MTPQLDDIVVTDGNRNAFERVIGITQKRGRQTRIFMYGPSGSGKTAVLRARGVERDMLSDRRVLFTHAAELASAIRFGTSEKLLADAGEVDVLLIDSLDAFFKESIGVDVCRLLVAERNRLGLDTVIGALMPRCSYDLSRFEGVFDAFEEIAVEPLDGEGRVELVRRTAKRYGAKTGRPVALSEEALSFVANEFADDLRDIDLAIRFLVTEAGFSETTVSREEVRAVLGKR